MFKRCICCCGCRSKSEEQLDLPNSPISTVGGITNNIFETWEPIEQIPVQKSSSLQRKSSKSSRASFETISLPKIDLKLNLFENNRFNDMSKEIHKNNIDNINHV